MNTLLMLLRIFPLILGAVTSVEAALPLPGAGKLKLDLVLAVVKEAFDGAADLQKAFSWDKLVALVTSMVATIVTLHNALGAFNTTPKPVAPVV